MKASFKGKYDGTGKPASATVSVNVSNVKVKATITEATFANGPSFNGLALSLEKPGAFILDYDVPRKDARFQFMNSVKVLFDKPLNLTYIHFQKSGMTTVDGALVFDPANKLSANYLLGSGHCKAKYTFTHGGRCTFEPSYDFRNHSWDFAASQKLFDGTDVVKASYLTSKKVVGLEWSHESKDSPSFKVGMTTWTLPVVPDSAPGGEGNAPSINFRCRHVGMLVP